MQRIIVLNPKGGSGKSTIATSLAGYLAAADHQPVLLDRDPQGSSSHWFSRRSPDRPPVHLIKTWERSARTTLTFRLHPPVGTTHVVVDTPAAVSAQDLPELTRTADKILVPVLPSAIDIHACSSIIRDLLLVAKVRRDSNQLAVIANRVRVNTLIYDSLIRFLATLGIPIVATLRDSQNYVRAAENGLSIHELKSYVAREDIESWQPLLDWLERPSERGACVADYAGVRAAVDSIDADARGGASIESAEPELAATA